MIPKMIVTVTLEDDEPQAHGSYGDKDEKPKGRVLYCRKCEGHGIKVTLKNHSPSCPYILCTCKSCEKLNYKRLKSFNKRNKEKIELAAALNAKRNAEEFAAAGSSYDSDRDRETSRRSSISSKVDSPDMDSNDHFQAPSSSGLEGRSMSLGAMTVMSYDIWKAKCASEKKRLEEERASKVDAEERRAGSSSPGHQNPKQSPPPSAVQRKRAHTFVARTNKTDEIPVLAAKKAEEKKGKYIVLPTIPAIRILVDEMKQNKIQEDVKPTTSSLMSAPPAPPPLTSLIPCSAFQPVNQQISTIAPPTQLHGLPRPSPVNPIGSLFKSMPMAPPPMPSPMSPLAAQISQMTPEQILSSLTLHNAVFQHQSNQMMDLLANLGQPGPAPTVDVLAVLRLQQQAAQLAAALQTTTTPQLQPPMPVVTSTTPFTPKFGCPPAATSAHILSNLLSNEGIYTNSV